MVVCHTAQEAEEAGLSQLPFFNISVQSGGWSNNHALLSASNRSCVALATTV